MFGCVKSEKAEKYWVSIMCLCAAVSGHSVGSLLQKELIQSTHSLGKVVNEIRPEQKVDSCPHPDELCLTEQCLDIAKGIVHKMDQTRDPCDDFFKFACGKWQKDNEFQLNDPMNILYSVTLNEMPKVVDEILEDLITLKRRIGPEFYSTKAFADLKMFHETCMDLQLIERHGFEPAYKLLESLSEFQARRRFNASRWNLTKALAQLAKINGHPLFQVALDTSLANSSKWVPVITIPKHYGLITSEVFGKTFTKSLFTHKNKFRRKTALLKEISRIFSTDIQDDFLTLFRRIMSENKESKLNHGKPSKSTSFFSRIVQTNSVDGKIKKHFNTINTEDDKTNGKETNASLSIAASIQISTQNDKKSAKNTNTLSKFRVTGSPLTLSNPVDVSNVSEHDEETIFQNSNTDSSLAEIINGNNFHIPHSKTTIKTGNLNDMTEQKIPEPTKKTPGFIQYSSPYPNIGNTVVIHEKIDQPNLTNTKDYLQINTYLDTADNQDNEEINTDQLQFNPDLYTAEYNKLYELFEGDYTMFPDMNLSTDGDFLLHPDALSFPTRMPFIENGFATTEEDVDVTQGGHLYDTDNLDDQGLTLQEQEGLIKKLKEWANNDGSNSEETAHRIFAELGLTLSIDGREMYAGIEETMEKNTLSNIEETLFQLFNDGVLDGYHGNRTGYQDNKDGYYVNKDGYHDTSETTDYVNNDGSDDNNQTTDYFDLFLNDPQEMMRFISALRSFEPTDREKILLIQEGNVFTTMTVGELQKRFPMVDWRYILEDVVKVEMKDDDEVAVPFIQYMEQMFKLLQQQTPKLVHDALLTLYSHDVLKELVSPSEDDMQRSEFCFQATKEWMVYPLTHMYLKHLGDDALKNLRNDIQPMVAALKHRAKVEIMRSQLFSAEDKKNAELKIDKMLWEIGGHDSLYNLTFVNELHKNLMIGNSHFLHNAMSVYKSGSEIVAEMYKRPLETVNHIWSSTTQPYIINAFYVQTMNAVG